MGSLSGKGSWSIATNVQTGADDASAGRQGPAPSRSTPAALLGSLGIDRREPRAGVVLLALSGELDLATASSLQEQLAREAAALVVVDLSGVEFMDSTGLGALVTANGRIAEAGGQLVIVRGSRQVQRLLKITGVDQRLQIVAELATALALTPSPPIPPTGPAGSTTGSVHEAPSIGLTRSYLKSLRS